MSMACASMRSRRCCIATTPAVRGKWIPNVYGGRENLEAIGFLRHFNAVVGERCAGAITVAEEFDRMARRYHDRSARAVWASPTSGTWAGCTTRSAISSMIRSIDRGTTTT